MAGANYEIVVRGRLAGSLTRWADELEVTVSGPDTVRLRGWFADQAGLQGLVRRLGALGVELSSLRRLPDTAEQAPTT